MKIIIDPKADLTFASVASPAARTATFTSSAIDLNDYPNGVTIILDSAAGTGTSPTLDGKIQSSTTSGGSYADVSGATFTQITSSAASFQTVTVDKRVSNRYIKFVGTIAGTSPSFTFGVSMVGQKQSF